MTRSFRAASSSAAVSLCPSRCNETVRSSSATVRSKSAVLPAALPAPAAADAISAWYWATCARSMAQASLAWASASRSVPVDWASEVRRSWRSWWEMWEMDVCGEMIEMYGDRCVGEVWRFGGGRVWCNNW